MTKTLWWLIGLAAIVAAGVFACSASQPASQTASPGVVLPTATSTPLPMARTNPNIVEEDELHFVERFPKEEMIRVDSRHIRMPIIAMPVEFYKEDDQYYYVFTYKRNTELDRLEKLLRSTPTATPTARPADPNMTPTPAGPLLSDFEDLSPSRVSGRLRLETLPSSGLPQTGYWRASFVVADINGDGIPDVIAPPSRLGSGRLSVWLGDGKGHFSPWPLRLIENGKPTDLGGDYGAVAVGDIDGDRKADIVWASHGGGLVSLFGDGNGTFRVVRTGLPGQEFSSQAIVLADAGGDGKLDIVASRDNQPMSGPIDDQVRVYLYKGAQGWQYKPDGIKGGFYSNSLTAWDFDGDGKKDVLTGSHYVGALTLLWKNLGTGQFAPVRFPEIEVYAYHFATAPGTFGPKRVPAFADAFYMLTNDPPSTNATGISVYSFEGEAWTRHRIWRKKSGKTAQYGLAMGDLDGDGLDDVVFPDSDLNRLRIFFQRPGGTFVEMAEKEEPEIDSLGQCVRLADVDGDGRLDVILSKTVASYRPNDVGGWSVYLNKR